MEKQRRLLLGKVVAKVIAVFASVSLCVSMIGCGKEPAVNDTLVDQSVQQESEPVVEKIEDVDVPLGSIEVEEPEQTQQESTEETQTQEPVVVDPVFEGAVDEAFETDAVDWFVNASEEDVITLVYTCVDDTHGGWGVVGWGASVNGQWKEGPTFAADKENPLTVLSCSVSVKDMKASLGVAEDDVIDSIKVSAWNGGQIVAIYVTSADQLPELSNVTEVEFKEATTITEEEEEKEEFEWADSYAKEVATVSNLELKFADYIPGFTVGTPVIIEMKMESDGLFNGGLGTCIGSDYAWTTCEFASDTGSEITVKWEVLPSIDNVQLQFWAIEGTKVGISSIEMKATAISSNTIVGSADSNKPSMNGSYLAKYTTGGEVSYNIDLPSAGWTLGDTVRVTVVYECDGGANGAFGTCVGSNYDWTTSGWSTDNYGTHTTSFEATPSIDNVQFQIYYVGGSALGIKSVSVAVVASPYSGTLLAQGANHSVSISSLCPGVEDGDTVRLSATLYSGDVYNGCIGGSDAEEKWVSSNGESSGGESTWSVTISNVDADADVQVQIWWTNTGKVALKSLTGTIVAKGEGTDEDGEDDEEGDGTEGGEGGSEGEGGQGGTEGGEGGQGGTEGGEGGSEGEGGQGGTEGDDETTPTVDYAAIAALPGTEYVTEEKTCDAWAQAVTVYTTNWGGMLNLTTLTENHYWVVTYTSDNAPQLILQDPWTTINAVYVENGIAVFDYNSIITAYADLSAPGALNIGAQGSALTVTGLKLVDASTGSEGGEGGNEGGEVISNPYQVVLLGTDWWSEQTISLETLLGSLDASKVESITFTSAIPFTVGYNATAGWAQFEGQTSYTLTDIDFANYFVKVCISMNDGAEYAISWTHTMQSDDGNTEGDEGGQGGTEGDEGGQGGTEGDEGGQGGTEGDEGGEGGTEGDEGGQGGTEGDEGGQGGTEGDEGGTEGGTEDDNDNTDNIASLTHTFDVDYEGQEAYIVDLNSQFADLEVGDTVELTVTFTSSSYYGGGMGANTVDETSETGYSWKQVEFSNDAGGTATMTIVVPTETGNNTQVQMWWIGDADVDMQLDIKKIDVEAIVDENNGQGGQEGGEGDQNGAGEVEDGQDGTEGEAVTE